MFLSASPAAQVLLFFSWLVGWLVGFLTSSSTTRLYRGRAPRQSVWQFYVLPHMRQSWETMTSVSAGHIILTPTQPVGSGRSGNRTRHLLTRSRALYRRATAPPPPPRHTHTVFFREDGGTVSSLVDVIGLELRR